MTRQQPPSLYADMDAVRAKKPGTYRYSHEEMDTLQQRIDAFNKARSHGGAIKDAEYFARAKTTLMDMTKALVRAAPRQIGGDEFSLVPDVPTAAISNALDKLEAALDNAHFNEAGESGSASREEATKQFKKLIEAIDSKRAQIQPMRPRLKPGRRYEMAAPSIELYAPFARAVAEASKADHDAGEKQHFLGRLPRLEALGREVQGYCAMLEFAETVGKLLDECKGRTKMTHNVLKPIPERHVWNINKEKFLGEIADAAKRFDEALAPLHLKVNAGSADYQQCVAAINKLRHAKHYETAKKAHDTLKHHALQYVLGGVDVWQGEDTHVHKLLTRINEAYKKDTAGVPAEKDEFERRVDIDRAAFMNDVRTYNLHTLARTYEARWALAATDIASMLDSYKATITNPDVRPAGDRKPQPELGEARKRPRSKRSEKPASADELGSSMQAELPLTPVAVIHTKPERDGRIIRPNEKSR